MFRASQSILTANFGVDSLSGLFWANFRQVSATFLNTKNSETAEANRLKLRLLRGSPSCYEPAKSELSGSNSRKVIFRSFDPTVSLGVG
jgi:hypothetical protein